MNCKKITALLSSFFYLGLLTAQTNSLPRSTPEAEGVAAQNIITFLDSAAVTKHEFHSFMFLRHGKVIAEGWWNPYSADLKHTLYSCSKSFTATAIGFAVSEHLLNVNDKVISFFPGELPDTLSEYLKELTVKDVLMMSDGQEPDPTGVIVSTKENWVKGFLALPILHEPGTTFLYNSLGTYMLSAIVQKVTNQKVIDYLKPRLFDPLGITGMDWETDTHGINTGGWGLRLKTEDMAKFGQLFLQKGMWNGKQILPAAWVNEASTTKIIQHPDMPQSKRDSSDWEQGYCYQMWRCRNNAYRGDGAYGQYIIVMPEQDAVIAITSETTDMQGELNLVWKYLLPSMHTTTLAADKDADKRLRDKLSSLALQKPAATEDDAIEKNIDGKTFTLAANTKKINAISFNFKKDKCIVNFVTDTATYSIGFGEGDWQYGQTTMHGPYLVAAAKNSLTNLPPFKIVGDYDWLSDKKLELVLRYIESPHTERLRCKFNGNDVEIEIENSFKTNFEPPITILKGTIKQ